MVYWRKVRYPICRTLKNVLTHLTLSIVIQQRKEIETAGGSEVVDEPELCCFTGINY